MFTGTVLLRSSRVYDDKLKESGGDGGNLGTRMDSGCCCAL